MTTQTLYGTWDANGDWVATDKDGNPRLSRDERMVTALESIARSLEKIANPPVKVEPEPPTPRRRACLVESNGLCPNYCRIDEPCKLAHHRNAFSERLNKRHAEKGTAMGPDDDLTHGRW